MMHVPSFKSQFTQMAGVTSPPKPERNIDLNDKQFLKKWTHYFYLVEFNATASCLTCKEKAAQVLRYRTQKYLLPHKISGD